jgi:hypothetical protein
MNKLCGAVCAALLVMPAIAMAEESAMGCDSVNFSEEVLAAFPKIRDACQAVTMKDGKPYVKLKAKVVAKDKDTVTVQMMDRQNKPISEVKVAPGADDSAKVEGKEMKYKDLQKGQDLDVYLEHNRWGLYSSLDKSNMMKIVSRKEL